MLSKRRSRKTSPEDHAKSRFWTRLGLPKPIQTPPQTFQKSNQNRSKKKLDFSTFHTPTLYTMLTPRDQSITLRSLLPSKRYFFIVFLAITLFFVFEGLRFTPSKYDDETFQKRFGPYVFLFSRIHTHISSIH